MVPPLPAPVLTCVLCERVARRCYSMEVELVGADFVGNELQRCGLLLGASGESAPPCPALRWPTCGMRAALCDPLGVRMQVEDRLAGGVGREVGGWAGLELGVGAGAGV